MVTLLGTSDEDVLVDLVVAGAVISIFVNSFVFTAVTKLQHTTYFYFCLQFLIGTRLVDHR